MKTKATTNFVCVKTPSKKTNKLLEMLQKQKDDTQKELQSKMPKFFPR